MVLLLAPTRSVRQLLVGLLACVFAGSTAFAQPKQAPAAPAAPQQPAYKLGPEDVVTVTVLNHPELSGDVVVSADGTVNLFGAGQLGASGETLPELKASVVSLLQTNKAIGLLKPIVSCALKSPRIQRLYVLGDVKAPGVYDAKPGWRISEAVAAAGGLQAEAQGIAAGATQPQASDFSVSVLHASAGPAAVVPLVDALSGAPDKDLPVAAGDVVFVRSLDLIPVYVSGCVLKPGIYQIRKDSTDVMKAIAMAGGFQPNASTAHVRVTHTTGQTQLVDLSSVVEQASEYKGPVLASGDLILVPELQSRVAVLGMVKGPGVYPMPDGKVMRLYDAIGLAQGYDTKRAKLSHVAVVDEENGHQVRHVYNFGSYLRKGDLAMNPIISPNSLVFVPETDSPEWSDLGGIIGAFGSVLFGVHEF